MICKNGNVRGKWLDQSLQNSVGTLRMNGLSTMATGIRSSNREALSRNVKLKAKWVNQGGRMRIGWLLLLTERHFLLRTLQRSVSGLFDKGKKRRHTGVCLVQHACSWNDGLMATDKGKIICPLCNICVFPYILFLPSSLNISMLVRMFVFLNRLIQ
jgi:hypothetical protein